MSRIEYHIMSLTEVEEMLEENREDISERIKRLRKAAGYSSAAAFAKKAGFTASKYTHYEQSNTSMPLEVAMRIAECLGVSLDVLAYGEKEQHPKAEDLAVRISRLDNDGIEELISALDFIEFKANRRKFKEVVIDEEIQD